MKLALVVKYRDQTIPRDTLSSGVTSSLSKDKLLVQFGNDWQYTLIAFTRCLVQIQGISQTGSFVRGLVLGRWQYRKAI